MAGASTNVRRPVMGLDRHTRERTLVISASLLTPTSLPGTPATEDSRTGDDHSAPGCGAEQGSLFRIVASIKVPDSEITQPVTMTGTGDPDGRSVGPPGAPGVLTVINRPKGLLASYANWHHGRGPWPHPPRGRGPAVGVTTADALLERLDDRQQVLPLVVGFDPEPREICAEAHSA
jgi:hypothetical protein